MPLQLSPPARLLFGRPDVIRPAPLGPHPDRVSENLRLPVNGAVLNGYATAVPPDRNPAQHPRLLLWLGGRNEHIAWTTALPTWLGPDWAVASFQYRGTGHSTGVGSEARAIADSAALLGWCKQRYGVEDGDIVIAGRSLGCAVATGVVARLHEQGRQVRGLVLLSPMPSLKAVMARRRLGRWVSPLLGQSLNCLARAHRIEVPVAIFTAAQDTLVTPELSLDVARALSQRTTVQYRCIEGTHHQSLPRNRQTLRALAEFANAL